jgi:hypothetical protein
VRCSTEEIDSIIDTNEADRIIINDAVDPVDSIELGNTELTAGQHIDSGTVTVDATATGTTVN